MVRKGHEQPDAEMDWHRVFGNEGCKDDIVLTRLRLASLEPQAASIPEIMSAPPRSGTVMVHLRSSWLGW